MATKLSLAFLSLALIVKASSLGVQQDDADACQLDKGMKPRFDDKHVSLEDEASEDHAKNKCCERNMNPDPNVQPEYENSVLFNDGFTYTFMQSKSTDPKIKKERCASNFEDLWVCRGAPGKGNDPTPTDIKDCYDRWTPNTGCYSCKETFGNVKFYVEVNKANGHFYWDQVQIQTSPGTWRIIDVSKDCKRPTTTTAKTTTTKKVK